MKIFELGIIETTFKQEVTELTELIFKQKLRFLCSLLLSKTRCAF